jgi:hypothetical protein
MHPPQLHQMALIHTKTWPMQAPSATSRSGTRPCAWTFTNADTEGHAIISPGGFRGPWLFHAYMLSKGVRFARVRLSLQSGIVHITVALAIKL